MNIKLSIIVSAYNEESNIIPLYDRLTEALQPIGISYEIILVNDGSTDETLARSLKIREQDSRFKVLNFQKNHGHELAMTAGMDYAKGDAVIFMDADLQHPPELIPEMVEAWTNGYKIVLTIRDKNYNASMFHKINTTIYTRVFNMLSNVKLLKNAPDFRLIDRTYVDFLKKFKETGRLFRGLLNFIIDNDSDNIYFLHFEAPKRTGGKTKYTFLKKNQLALNSIIQFSIVPLRLVSFIGIIAIIISLILAIIVIVEYFVYDLPSTGYGTTMITMIFLGSTQLLFLGIIAEYIGRIHIEVKDRPLYFAEFFDDNNKR